MKKLDEWEAEAFLNRFDKGEPHECWNWNGSLSGDGYGMFYSNYKRYRAHRLSYLMHKGPLDSSLVIDHLCSNPKCVNPNHLRQVSQKENVFSGNSVIAKNLSKTKCVNGHALEGTNLKIAKDGSRYCYECNRASNSKSLIKRKLFQREVPEFKNCSGCGLVFPKEKFAKDYRVKTGLSSRCLSCRYSTQKKYRARKRLVMAK
jgi:hypothetical protein